MKKYTYCERYNPWRAVIQIFVQHCVGLFYFFYNRFRVIGKENVPQDGPFLAVSNHLSLNDPPIVTIAIGKPLGFVAKTELFKLKWLRPIISLLGAVEINREKPTVSSIRTIKQAFAAGWCIGIFIEGTRNKAPGVLGQPHTGAAYFAWSNKVKILPVGVIHTNERGGKGIVRIGKPIEPSADLEKTTWEIMQAISDLTAYKLPEHIYQ